MLNENIQKLQEKIDDLKKLSFSTNIDLSFEIETLSKKLNQLKENSFKDLDAWQKVSLSRDIKRPTTLDYISHICSDFIELHGDRLYKDDLSIVGGIGVIDGINVTIVGHQKGNDLKENVKRNFGMPHPEGYRKALRLMKQAEKFNRPIVTFIDTPGAFCGLEAEERGQGEAIAQNLLQMSSLSVPVICIVIGEGGSGGALGIGIGNKVAMLEHSVYSVISPEGLSSILFKDASRFKEASKVMKLTSDDIKSLDVIDDIIKEPVGGAQNNVALMSRSIKEYILKELNSLMKLSKEEIVEDRYKKFRGIGS